MATRFFSLLRARFFGTPSETAVEVGVNGESNPRLSIDAGGRLNWGAGSATTDVNLYRDAADVLKTDDTFKAASLFVDAIEVDTTGAVTNDVLAFDGTKFAPSAVAGGGAATLDDLTDVAVTSPEAYQVLRYDGTEWINEFPTTVSLVENAETTTLAVGEVVYLYGGTGNHASVKRADNGSDATSSKTVGVVATAISSGAQGPVVTRGYVDGINLSTGYSAGDVLWLGSSGAFTTTKPTSPDHLVFVGVVVRATNNGVIYVATQNGYELEEIHDVSLSSLTSGDFLKWNGSLWVNDAIDLGTDTTGNYVSDVTAGTGVTITHTPGEGSSPTVAIGQDVATTADVTFNSVTADVTGNADTATTLETARTISLGGDLSGSASFNGSADVTITATIAADSVALGTDTTGNYVADVAGGTGVTVTHTPGEGSTPSVAIGQAVGTGDSPTFAGLTVDGDVTMNQTTPVLTINDTDATFGGTITSYVEYEANGTRAGYVGFPTSSRLYVRTENGDMFVQADSGSIYVIPGASAIVAFDDTKVRIYDDGTASEPVLTWHSDQNTGIFRAGADTLAFATAGSERVTIDSGGRVGVGVSSALAHNLTVLGAPWATSVGCIGVQATSSRVGLVSGSDSTASRYPLRFFNPNGEVGSIRTNGTATAYLTSSDYRLKENVTPVNDPVGRLQAIQVHDFNFVADPTVRVSGFIAHELSEIIPEAVSGEKDAVYEDGSIAPQGVDQSKVVPLLVAALQNALARIEALEAGN